MRVLFADAAWEDYQFWLAQDKQMLQRINSLIEAIRCDPFAGIGKPEPLKHALAGFWSRRINDEHRMVYCLENGALLVAQLRHHD